MCAVKGCAFAALVLVGSNAAADFSFRHHFVDRDLPGDSYGQTSLADIDRDGDLDFVTGGRDANRSVFWFEFIRAGDWKRHVLGTNHPSDVGGAAADIDGDGWTDHVSGGVWYRNTGKPRDEPFERIVFDGELAAVHDLVPTDLDGDGRTDFITMSDRNNLRWYRLPKDPRQPWERHDIGAGVHAGVAAGDIDGDGDLDIARSNLWFENVTGKADRWAEHAVPFGKPVQPYPLATRCVIADIDGDGHRDLVMTENEIRAGRIAWLKNIDGAGRQWKAHDLPPADAEARGAYHSLAVADFDLDKDLDIFTVEMEAIPGAKKPRWFIWENVDGKGATFRESVILDAGLGGHEAVVADVDRDGDLDICSKLWRPRADNANGGRNHADFLENLRVSKPTGAAPQAQPDRAKTSQARNRPWKRHVIDDSARGADGVRLADIDRDGRADIVTGWEESGLVRVYQNPGPSAATEKWPAVTVGRAPNVEDAVFVDLDRDGSLDVVGCSEGDTRAIFIHWAPRDPSRCFEPDQWTTERIIPSAGAMMWMFSLPVDLDGDGRVELVAGGKGPDASIGWWKIPEDPHRLAEWRWHPLRPAGWVMSIVSHDMNDDGAQDIVFSDRKGAHSGCGWLENPGPQGDPARSWIEHSIGGQGREMMFLAIADLDADGLADVLAAAKPKDICFFRRADRTGSHWGAETISLPDSSGNAKAVNAGDIDLDGRADLVFTCEGAGNGKSGVMWISRDRSGAGPVSQAHDISGPDGIKHDLVELLDLDGDGDSDVITCEESNRLGVIWYENPAR
jgi:hypothetical protein